MICTKSHSRIEVLKVYARKEMLDLRRHRKLVGSGGMVPHKIFQIWGLRNAISCVFRGTFSVNKYEGKCNNKPVVLFSSASVIGNEQCLRKKGKTVSHRGGYKQRARCLKTIQTGKDTSIMRKIYQSFLPNFSCSHRDMCVQGATPLLYTECIL